MYYLQALALIFDGVTQLFLIPFNIRPQLSTYMSEQILRKGLENSIKEKEEKKRNARTSV